MLFMVTFLLTVDEVSDENINLIKIKGGQKINMKKEIRIKTLPRTTKSRLIIDYTYYMLKHLGNDIRMYVDIIGNIYVVVFVRESKEQSNKNEGGDKR